MCNAVMYILSNIIPRAVLAKIRGEYILPIMQSHAFSGVGPVVWNALPLELRLFLRSLSDTFYKHLKTVLFVRAGVWSASE
jgi:hypothetical protein